MTFHNKLTLIPTFLLPNIMTYQGATYGAIFLEKQKLHSGLCDEGKPVKFAYKSIESSSIIRNFAITYNPY